MSDRQAVVATNDDATVSKLSAVGKGYYKDEFVKHFARKTLSREPLINRGYYCRVTAWQHLVRQFLAASAAGDSERRQIVSLGAGFDTTYWNLKSEGRLPAGAVWFELDLPPVVQRKAAIVRRQPALAACLLFDDPLLPLPPPSPASAVAVSPSAGGSTVVMAAADANGSGRGDEEQRQQRRQQQPEEELVSAQYRLAAADLCRLADVDNALRRLGVDFDQPTLLLSECVLVYLPVACSDALIAWAAAAFRRAAFATYEQIRPDDAFGRTMLLNLQARGCPLESLRQYGTLEAQIERYRRRGFADVHAADMQTVFDAVVASDPRERSRIEALEVLDELEEWRLFQQHYCIVVARNLLDQPSLHRLSDRI